VAQPSRKAHGRAEWGGENGHDQPRGGRCSTWQGPIGTLHYGRTSVSEENQRGMAFKKEKKPIFKEKTYWVRGRQV